MDTSWHRTLSVLQGQNQELWKQADYFHEANTFIGICWHCFDKGYMAIAHHSKVVISSSKLLAEFTGGLGENDFFEMWKSKPFDLSVGIRPCCYSYASPLSLAVLVYEGPERYFPCFCCITFGRKTNDKRSFLGRSGGGFLRRVSKVCATLLFFSISFCWGCA